MYTLLCVSKNMLCYVRQRLHAIRELNINTTVKKAQQRLYFLRRLSSFGLTTQIMLTFYRAAIESVLTFSIIVWFNWIYHSEGKTPIEQSYKTCFENNRLRPPQS